MAHLTAGHRLSRNWPLRTSWEGAATPSVFGREVLELGVGEDRAIGADVKVADVAPPALHPR